jgi:hypothetical protein
MNENQVTALCNEGWARMPKAGEKIQGLSRAHLYQLLTANKIRSKAIRQPGRIKGIRLVWVPSVVEYINNFPDPTATTGTVTD